MRWGGAQGRRWVSLLPTAGRGLLGSQLQASVNYLGSPGLQGREAEGRESEVKDAWRSRWVRWLPTTERELRGPPCRLPGEGRFQAMQGGRGGEGR